MKVLHVVLSYVPAYRHGGPVASVHALNKALVAAGIEVTVYTTNIDGRNALDVPLGTETNLDGVKIFYFPLTWRTWVYSRALHRALAAHAGEFDVIHVTSVFLCASMLGAYYAKKFGVPYLISPRGSLMKEPLAMKNALLKRIYLALVEKRNLAGAAAIHFTVEKEKEEYVAAGFPMKRSVVIPNAYEESEEDAKRSGGINMRKKLNISEEVPIVLSLGRITWKKGFDTLIPAFKEVKEKIPNAVLVIAGNDEEGYKQNVQLSIINYQLQDSVIFAGMVLGAEKEALLEAATVFTLPSYSENFGMAPVEAMAHGTAVIVTRNVGIADDVERAGAGIVVGEKTEQEDRVEEFADAMTRALREEGKEKRMGAKGRALVQEAYAPTAVAARMLRAYNEIANHGKIL